MTQKITIEPVTRIEGHAKVTIHLNDDGAVEHAYLHINEFRGFEKFCEGRLYFEMPSHHAAHLRDLSRSAITWPRPRPATSLRAVLRRDPRSLLRELMHMGQIIQSHGMHFFELAGPDLLLGFDADPAHPQRDRADQAPTPELRSKPVSLRTLRAGDHPHAGRAAHPPELCRAGRRQQGAAGGRTREHPRGHRPARSQQRSSACSIMKDWAATQHGRHQQVRGVAERLHEHWSTPTTVSNLYDGDIRLDGPQRRPAGKIRWAAIISDYIAEHVENWSYLKFPYYKKLGLPNGVYRVGPLGRMNAVDAHRHAAGQRGA
ncbi:MAG: hypothetical protein MZV64_62840 [Ignavibacteriales bacterium]|nr:hypothetical protein [Ignavibacteriales bacterium]